MGLEGTLRDFSVTDLLQVLGPQKKTGMLTIEGKEDRIAISFFGGQIVSADSAARGLEDRVGNLLVRAGKLSPEMLVRALEAQKETPARLGALLVRDRLVSPEDLEEALRLQMSRIVLGAFQWTEGRFRFAPQAVISYDAPHVSPVSTDAILTEAVQFLEEWPRLGRKVPSRDMVYRRVEGVENLRLAAAPEKGTESVLQVSRREAETWKWIDGRRRVGEILERAFLSDLDVYRGLADLLDRNLITEGGPAPEAGPPPAAKKAWISPGAVGLWILLLLAGVLAVRRVPANPWNLSLRPRGERWEVADVLKSVSLARLASVERATRIYYDVSGQYPRNLGDLLSAGVLSRESAVDPYGRPYRYILRSEDGKFSLYGRNPKGGIDLDLSFDRALEPVSESRPAPRPPQSPKQPGIQVIQ